MQTRVINQNQVLEKLYNIYPEFKEIFESEYDLVERGWPYTISGRFASYLLELYKQGNTNNFKAVAQLIEDLIINGDSYVQELAVIGYLEGIQNIWDNNNVDSEIFHQFLLSKSKKWWAELIKFWNGEIKYVGETYSEE